MLTKAKAIPVREPMVCSFWKVESRFPINNRPLGPINQSADLTRPDPAGRRQWARLARGPTLPSLQVIAGPYDTMLRPLPETVFLES
jgi:hypothetical protein